MDCLNMQTMDTIEELKKFVANSKECAASADELMQKAVEDENYVKAAEMKISKDLHMMFAMRVQRVIEGKPAFAEGSNSVVS